MILHTGQETDWTRGGGPIAWVGEFISYKHVDFGTALQNIEVTVFAPSHSKGANPPLGQSHVKLPSVIFRKNEKTLRIKWLAQHATLKDMAIQGPRSATKAVFDRAVADVYDALAWGLQKRLKPQDDFDSAACLAWVKAAQKVAPPDKAALRSILETRSEMYLHLIRTEHFQKTIKIDWSTMHEDAAHLLHHADLWSTKDPRMPHGNAWGKGILDNFAYYEHLSLDGVLKNLGMAPYTKASIYDDKVKALQAELGFVFAHIKKRGTVDADLTDALFQTMTLEAKVKNSFWVYRARHGTSSHFAWMRHYLEPFNAHKNQSS